MDQHATLHEDGIGEQETAFHVLVRPDAYRHNVDFGRIEKHVTRVQVLVDNHLQFEVMVFTEIAQQLVLKARGRGVFRVVINDFTIGHSDQSSFFKHMLHHRQGVANFRLSFFDFGFVVA